MQIVMSILVLYPLGKLAGDIQCLADQPPSPLLEHSLDIENRRATSSVKLQVLDQYQFSMQSIHIMAYIAGIIINREKGWRRYVKKSVEFL